MGNHEIYWIKKERGGPSGITNIIMVLLIHEFCFWHFQYSLSSMGVCVSVCVCVCVCQLLNHVRLFVTPWAVTHKASLSIGFSRQEYWSRLLFPSPEDLSDPGIEPESPTLTHVSHTDPCPTVSQKTNWGSLNVGRGKIHRSEQSDLIHSFLWRNQ